MANSSQDPDLLRLELRALSQGEATAASVERYHDLLEQLPLSERKAWQLLGDYDPDVFVLPHLFVTASTRAAQAIERSVGAPIAYWPELPPLWLRQHPLDVGTRYDPPDCYDALDCEDDPFKAWRRDDNRPFFFDRLVADSEAHRYAVLLEVSLDSVQIAKLVPRAWFRTRGRVVPVGERLRLLRRIADQLRWCGMQCIGPDEKPVWLILIREGAGDLRDRMRKAVEVAGADPFTVTP